MSEDASPRVITRLLRWPLICGVLAVAAIGYVLFNQQPEKDARLLGRVIEASNYCPFSVAGFEQVTDRYAANPKKSARFKAAFNAALIRERDTIASLRPNRLALHCANVADLAAALPIELFLDG